MNLNKVIIAGRTTKKPEVRSTPQGQSVSSFSIATSRTWTGKDGKKQEQTEFINIVFWGKQAEVIAQYVEKGQVLLIEGRLQTRKWQDKTGQVRYATEVIGENFQFGERAKNSGGYEKSQRSAKRDDAPDIEDITEGEEDVEIRAEDIPF